LIETHFEALEKGFLVDAGQRAQKRAIEIMESTNRNPYPQGALRDLAEVTQRWHKA